MANNLKLLDNLSLLIQIEESKASCIIKIFNLNSMVRTVSDKLTNSKPSWKYIDRYNKKCSWHIHSNEDNKKIQSLI